MKRERASAGDSAEQRGAEPAMLLALGAALGITLVPGHFDAENGSSIQVDGVSQDPLVLCEAYARHGALKGSQPDKVMADALKLLYVEKLLAVPVRKIVLFADEAAAKCFRGRSWAASAFKSLGIEVHVVNLNVGLAEGIRAAQIRQRR